ncbi:MAG: ion transporter [Candidatus Azobacteroides sp.]|nr:ion transporter [Candidatus Azobacteroides sp.]
MKIKNIFLNNSFVLCLIVLNALIIFFQEFNNVPGYMYYLDNIFTILFSIELYVKIRHFGFKTFWKSNWNKMDFIIISLALLSMMIEITNFQPLTSLEFLTTLRILRLFKTFRLVKFVPNIDSIISGVNNAVKTSYIVIFAFAILLFIVAVLTCSLFKDIAPEYFDTPVSSLYTVFRIFSIEGWYEIPDAIGERTSVFVSFLSKLYFVIILFVGGILGMSLINSIFVDAMVSDNNDNLENEVKKLSQKIESLTEEIRKLREEDPNF